jgi:orotidine-5'-phosphate decarboxylase
MADTGSRTNPILVALDYADPGAASATAHAVADAVGGFKIGSELFTVAGPALVTELRALGKLVFLDLKFHDIPNTVAKAVTAAAELGVHMLTVHASGGAAMLQAAEQAAQDTARRRGSQPPYVLAVTVLTSLESAELAAVGVASDVGRQVERLARLAVTAGLRGLVCSPLEIAALRPQVPSGFVLVTPGIRPQQAGRDDQKRVLTPKQALEAGADWLVIGRPICAAPDPGAAARAILESLELHAT